MRQQLGQQGELAAVQYLQDQGFTIIARNYKKFFGEIDIIAQRKNIIAFVEVKTRSNVTISMHELISPSKQHKIIQVARTFMSTLENPCDDTVYRFDVALIHAQQNKNELTYIANAFCMPEH